MSPAEMHQLLDQLQSGSIEEAVSASFELAKFGEVAVQPLIAILNDQSKVYSWSYAVNALEQIGDPRAVEPLIAMLQNPLSFEGLLARKYAAWALGKFRDARAVDVLIGMLHERLREEEDDDFVYDEPEYETIEAAAYALSEIGDLRGLTPVLDRIFAGDYSQSGDTLTKWGEPALNLLLEKLSSDDGEVRHRAAALLGEFGDKRAVEPLIQLLQTDTSASARHGAAYGLGELADPRAFDALSAALKDPYEQVRFSAVNGLEKLKNSRNSAF